MKPRVAYVISSQVAFVPHPRERCRWLRVHPCVLFTSCPDCGAPVTELCANKHGEAVGYTHWQRRKAPWREVLGPAFDGLRAIVVPLRRGR